MSSPPPHPSLQLDSPFNLFASIVNRIPCKNCVTCCHSIPRWVILLPQPVVRLLSHFPPLPLLSFLLFLTQTINGLTLPPPFSCTKSTALSFQAVLKLHHRAPPLGKAMLLMSRMGLPFSGAAEPNRGPPQRQVEGDPSQKLAPFLKIPLGAAKPSVPPALKTSGQPLVHPVRKNEQPLPLTWLANRRQVLLDNMILCALRKRPVASCGSVQLALQNYLLQGPLHIRSCPERFHEHV